MTYARAEYKGDPAGLGDLLRRLPPVLAGQLPATDRLDQLVRGVQLRVGVRALGLVQQDFLVKARGGVGSDGVKWVPLSPKTVERRRLGPADRQALTQKARTKELTDAQKAQARRDYARRRAQLILRGLDPERASALARAQAYNAVRAGGGKIATRRQILGGRQVEILRNTGILFQSLSPGVEDRPSGAAGQVFERRPGSVVVGTSVPYAATHQYGSGKVPRRPLWPDELPQAWADALAEAAKTGLANELRRWLAGRV